MDLMCRMVKNRRNGKRMKGRKVKPQPVPTFSTTLRAKKEISL